MLKICSILFFFLLCYCPITDIKYSDYYEAWNYVFKYQPRFSHRYAYCYSVFSKKYDVPLKLLLRQGKTESRFQWWKRGDGGQSVGPHQIKYKYREHQELLYLCDNGLLGAYFKRKKRKGEKIDYSAYLSRIGYNIECAAIKLSVDYNKYGNWGTALVSYGCGRNSIHFKRQKKDSNYCMSLKYVRDIIIK